jgi:ferredoxin
MTDELPGSKVRIMPLDVEIEVGAEESLMEAGLRSGLRWPSICGGEAVCATCYVKIEEGAESAAPMAPIEAERLQFAGRRDPAFRLACQMRVRGPMRVFQRGVKWREPPATEA